MGEQQVGSDTLVIDAAGEYAAVALFHNHTLLRYELSASAFSSEELAPLVHRVTLGQIRDVSRVVVTSGPGSYTGLRSAVATAIGLASALRIQIIGVPTLFGRGLALRGDRELFVPIMHAAGEQYYGVVYRSDSTANGKLNFSEIGVLAPSSRMELVVAAGAAMGADRAGDAEAIELLSCDSGDLEFGDALSGVYRAAENCRLVDRAGAPLIKIALPGESIAPQYGRGVNAKTIVERAAQR